MYHKRSMTDRVLAMLLSLVLGIPLGLVMGRCKNRWPDKLGTALPPPPPHPA